ncbi:hypothetical protein ACJZ2D_003698 [Fusarium nematophilum]
MPPLQEVDPNVRTLAKRRGPRPKPYSERQYTPRAPIQRVQRSYSRRKKEEVIIWLTHHRVEGQNGVFKPPSLRDAADHFKISHTTIAGWWRHRDDILPHRQTRQYSPYWPKLEEELYSEFQGARKRRKVVTTSWFRIRARQIFARMNPGFPHLFTFSNGWWQGFLRRHNIVKRRVTKQATKRPEEYIDIINRFLRFLRRISIQRGRSDHMKIIVGSPRRRFRTRRILNLDETPIPFEYLDGSTWETCGSKTVSAHSDRSGWNKRQSTLILYIFADGILRIRPVVIFHGKPTDEGGQIYEKEKHLYHPSVAVEFNDTAYNNEDLFLRWIRDDLSKLTSDEDEELLLVMDAATFHKTQPVKDALKELGEATDEYVECKEREEGPDFIWTVSEKRIMITHVVAAAIQQLEARPEMVAKAFLNCGISVRPDGAEDNLIRIKDISPDQIDFTGWEEAEEITVKAEDPVDTLLDDIEFIGADDEELMMMTRYHEELVVHLKEKLRARGLKVSGKKAELVRRLQEDDSQKSQRSEVQETIYVYSENQQL